MANYDSDGGTPASVTAHPDYSTPLTDEYGFLVGDRPDTVPWCPEEDIAGVVPMHGAGMDSIIPKNHRLPAVAYGSLTVWAVNGTSYGPTNVGFPINSVIVSNWTPQWVKVGGEWVPPFGINGVIRLTSASSQASITWEAPIGVTQPGATTGAQCKVDFCEEPLAPKPFTIADTGGAGSATIVAGSHTPADATANPTDAVDVETFNMVWNGTTWDRCAEIPATASTSVPVTGVPLIGIGLLGGASQLSQLRDLRGNTGDGSTGGGVIAVAPRLSNGTTFDQGRLASATNMTLSPVKGVQLVAAPGGFSITSQPAANTQATITQAAGGAGVRHICTSISAALTAGATAGAAVFVNLRDGATGVGTILWSTVLNAPATGSNNVYISGLAIVGSANTAMTLEFAAAGGATTNETVSLTGYDVV